MMPSLQGLRVHAATVLFFPWLPWPEQQAWLVLRHQVATLTLSCLSTQGREAVGKGRLSKMPTRPDEYCVWWQVKVREGEENP